MLDIDEYNWLLFWSDVDPILYYLFVLMKFVASSWLRDTKVGKKGQLSFLHFLNENLCLLMFLGPMR